ncbi:MAG: two-component sensor histidine kinase BarA [Kangiellaceae bacterium]|nr:two-component sensor histidine kinase BarA [Kangiellaceae bacterium]
MNDWGIRARVILLAIVPTGLVAIVMGSYFVASRVQDLDVSVRDRGLTIANYVAQTAEYSLLSGNKKTLARLVSAARDGDADIMAVAIYSKSHFLLASSGAQELIKKLPASSENVSFQQANIQQIESGLIIRAPIFSQPIQVEREEYRPPSQLPIIGHVSVMITDKNNQLRQYQTMVTAVIILLIGLILGGLLAHNMARNITIPIIQLANAVKRIKEGQLKVAINSSGTGELKTLVDGFNDMSDSLYEAREEMQLAIEQATADINATNTALEEQNVELNMARKEAIEASRVKSEFLANMSHEIRTPMNGVIGFTNLLLRSKLTDQQNDYLGTIRKSANGLLAIIDDILDFSKIEAGKMEMENLSFSINECVDATLNLLAPAAQAKNIEILGIIYQDVPTRLKGDSGRIGQILNNLCNNAIKFTEKGTIQIRVMLEEDNENSVKLKFNITDTGVGLSEKQKKILFQAFTQADTTTTRRFGGTGLGLVISKKLVESMHGKIGIESKENIGSTFWFTLKLDKESEYHAETELGFPGRRILFHDANNTSQLATNYLLGRWGTIVENAETLEELIEKAEQFREQKKDVHLVLVGGYGPTKSQTKLLRLQRAAKKLGSPMAVLVNSKEERQLQEYSDIGINKLFTKPIIRKPFHDALAKWFVILEQTSGRTSTASDDKNSELNVLSVDDNEANLKLIDAFLSDFELKKTVVDSGSKAVEQCRNTEFDIIFMDMQMPEMDGLEATKKIRQLSEHNRRIPVIALTAHAMKGEKERLLNEGMDDYLTKPISQTQLQASIEQWTETTVLFKVDAALSIQTNSAQPTNLSIDWQLSLKNAAGREDLAKEMLSMLIKSFDEAKSKIDLHIKNDDLENLIAEVHKLHGATAYCGVPQLKYLANKFESELKNSGITENTKQVQQVFLKELVNITQDSESILL